MVYGGLIGNKDTGYSVTHKADGQRKLLVFHRSGIWLVMAKQIIMKVSSKQIPTLYGTILDGEMIPLDKRVVWAPTSTIWYLAFDTLAVYDNNIDIQKKPHGKRMQYAQDVSDIISNSSMEQSLKVSTKTFYNFGTPQEFFKIMRNMFREQIDLPYKQDGFMFTPQNTEYNPHSDKHKLYKRVLTSYPDICKWKPKEQLTIDFLIKWKLDVSSPIGRKIKLHANVKGFPKLFTGSLFQKYDDNIDSEASLTLDLPNNSIVKYEWD